MNNKAFYDITIGLYLVTVESETVKSGCIINTFTQVGSNPKSVIISVNKDNYTTTLIQKKMSFHISVMSQNTTMEFIKRFGFASGRDVDKFEGLDYVEDDNKNPFTKDFSIADFTCEVKNIQDVGSHLLMIAEVIDANKNHDDEALTYSYYQKHLKGSTPKNAVSYQEKKSGYTCEICGYTYEGEELPENFVCPVCGAPIAMMKKND